MTIIQALILSQQEVVASSEAKNQAFLQRIDNLSSLIGKLTEEQVALDRMVIAKESEIRSIALAENEMKLSLEAKISSLALANQALESSIASVEQEIAAVQASYQARFQALAAEQAQMGDLSAKLSQLSQEVERERACYHRSLHTQCKLLGLIR